MRNFHENKDSFNELRDCKVEAVYLEPDDSVSDKKALSRKNKAGKAYKVIITYVQLTDEEAKTKRAIVESILKKVFIK